MIRLDNVSSGYGKTKILDGISLSLDRGRLISVIGPNGSGKSTLLKTIVGTASVLSGKILCDEVDTSTLSIRDTAKRISYLSQGKSTPDMTVGQLVLHGRFPYLKYPRRYSRNDRDIAASAMKATGVYGVSDRHLSTLSGGMRQNAYIAMALAQDTDYILLDEPTTYLDIGHRLELMKTLKSLADSGKCVVAVMHDLPLAFAFSDSIAVIRDGSLVANAAPESVCDSGVITDVFGVTLTRNDDGYAYRY